MWLACVIVVVVLALILYVPVPKGWKRTWAWQLCGAVVVYTGRIVQLLTFYHELRGRSKWFAMRLIINIVPHSRTDWKIERWDDVPVYIFIPGDKDAISGGGIIYFHGGGWVVGNVEKYAYLCQSMANYTKAVVISPLYRKSPEHPFPAAYDDCFDVTTHFMKHASEYGVDPNRIALTGDSAGGNLAAAVTHRMSNDKESIDKPAMQYLLYPALQFSVYNLPSAMMFEDDPILSRTLMDLFRLSYLGFDGNKRVMSAVRDHGHLITDGKLNAKVIEFEDRDLIPERFRLPYKQKIPLSVSIKASEKLTSSERECIQSHCLNPTLAPLIASDEELKTLPKTYVLTCNADVLRDEGIIYVERMRRVGADVTHVHLEDKPHGATYFSASAGLSIDKETDAVVIEYFRALKDNL